VLRSCRLRGSAHASVQICDRCLRCTPHTFGRYDNPNSYPAVKSVVQASKTLAPKLTKQLVRWRDQDEAHLKKLATR
jgi:hypothetical protein